MAYRSYGRGPVQLVAFHGFGRTGSDFAFLADHIGDRCTIHAFDLPFHGASPAPLERAERPFAPDELADFLAAFADGLGSARITLLGYSLGGRVALSLLERTPQRIGKVFLVAPDGLRHRPWYRGLANSGIGRAAYAWFIAHPGAVHTVIHALGRTGLLDERMHRFLIGQSDTRAKRELMRNVWLSFRDIEPDLPRVARNVRQYHVPLQLVFGERDRVIKPTFARRLRPLAPEQVAVHLLATGHVALVHELATWLAGEDLAGAE